MKDLAVSGSYSTNGWFAWLTPQVIGLIIGAGIGAIFLIKLWNALPKWLIVVILLILGVGFGIITINSH